MLTVEEIKKFMDADLANPQKRYAKIGQRYYDGEHDILKNRIFYVDDDGNLQEDKWRKNTKISHPFFTELTDQTTQYFMAVDRGFVRSDIPELQKKLDDRFNENEDFHREVYETITDMQVKGCGYMYAYKDENDKTAYQNADSMNVVEIKARDASDKQDHVLYWYIDKSSIQDKQITRIQVWDKGQTHFYFQGENGEIVKDKEQKPNPSPHTLYTRQQDGTTVGGSFDAIPFYPLENNKKRISSLKPIKPIMDDYDMMSCGLSNNIGDFDHPIYFVSGFDGNNLDELIVNVHGKKVVGVPDGGSMDIKTVDIPYQARLAKMAEDKEDIFRFGYGINAEGLKDTSATTNLAIKMAYLYVDLKAYHMQIMYKQFMRKLLKPVLQEINEENGTGYSQEDVYFVFDRELPTNELENAQIKQAEAATRQMEVNTIMNLQTVIGDDDRLKLIAEQLDIDYEELKANAPVQEDLDNAIDSIPTDETAGDTI